MKEIVRSRYINQLIARRESFCDISVFISLRKVNSSLEIVSCELAVLLRECLLLLYNR